MVRGKKMCTCKAMEVTCCDLLVLLGYVLKMFVNELMTTYA